jgi:hypothetical protein
MTTILIGVTEEQRTQIEIDALEAAQWSIKDRASVQEAFRSIQSMSDGREARLRRLEREKRGLRP